MCKLVLKHQNIQLMLTLSVLFAYWKASVYWVCVTAFVSTKLRPQSFMANPSNFHKMKKHRLNLVVLMQ